MSVWVTVGVNGRNKVHALGTTYSAMLQDGAKKYDATPTGFENSLDNDGDWTVVELTQAEAKRIGAAAGGAAPRKKTTKRKTTRRRKVSR